MLTLGRWFLNFVCATLFIMLVFYGSAAIGWLVVYTLIQMFHVVVWLYGAVASLWHWAFA